MDTDFALDFPLVRFLLVKIPAGILKWMHPFVLHMDPVMLVGLAVHQ